MALPAPRRALLLVAACLLAAPACSGLSAARSRGPRMELVPTIPSFVLSGAPAEPEAAGNPQAASNWRLGYMEHRTVVKGSARVRGVRFVGEELAFGTAEGRAYLVDMHTGGVLDRYHSHVGEVTGVDFDGVHMASVGLDRCLNVYRVTRQGLEGYGAPLHRRKPFDGRAVGVCLWRGTHVVSASTDGTIVSVDLATGETAWETRLRGHPISLGVSDEYMAVGLSDGRVVCLSSSQGRYLVDFRAHRRGVRAVYMADKTTLFTGGDEGVVRRWDLSGDPTPVGAEPPPRSLHELYVQGVERADREKKERRARRRAALVAEELSLPPPAMEEEEEVDRDVDEPFLKDLPVGTVASFHGHTAAVLALQGDADKVVSGATDGSIRVWDVASREVRFEMHGRTAGLSSLQFDESRLVADGTRGTVVLHDFGVDVGRASDSFEYNASDAAAAARGEEPEEE